MGVAEELRLHFMVVINRTFHKKKIQTAAAMSHAAPC
jgi:hypothetical protein